MTIIINEFFDLNLFFNLAKVTVLNRKNMLNHFFMLVWVASFLLKLGFQHDD
jgi:hypothetical protein